MIRKVLIANRGEIAVRIIRACKELGIKTVAIYSEVDKNAIHTELADEAICVGTSKSKDSYLNESNILSAAVITGCNAIHPGFGFLSENTSFAGMCEECNIKFIGPSKEIINIMGNKSMAREIMKNANIPIIPGSEGLIRNLEEAKSEAKKIGYPVMIKASLGGGGKGIRVVLNENELEKAYFTAKAEAKNNFNDDSVYMEKFIENPRHIEVQILGDAFGNVIHLYERDCTIQRRNQKVLEEAPAIILNDELRNKMGTAAVNAAKAVNYESAGTIEFLLDKHGDFYFMEMNTRIQVEHPVTEMVTSVDIVKEQLNIANGIELSLNKDVSEDLKTTDILISDFSSIIPMFYFMNKPVIYTDADMALNEEYCIIMDNSYIADNWNKVREYIDDLVNGIDLKSSQRYADIKEQYKLHHEASRRIVDCLVNDYIKNEMEA